METYNQTPEKHLFNVLEVDQSGKLNLAEAGRWAKFLGVLGIIMLAIMMLGGLTFVFMAPAFMDQMPQSTPISKMGGVFAGILYLIMGLLYFYPTWAILKFGTLIRSGIRNENQAIVNEAFLYLKRFFKFIGVLTMIIIGLYILAIIAISLGATFGTR